MGELREENRIVFGIGSGGGSVVVTVYGWIMGEKVECRQRHSHFANKYYIT